MEQQQIYLQVVETSERIANPSDQEIQEYVISSPGGPCTGVILSKNERTFMQTTGDVENGYALEYLDEESGILFHCHWISAEDVISAMQAYAWGLDWWKKTFDWQYWLVVSD